MAEGRGADDGGVQGRSMGPMEEEARRGGGADREGCWRRLEDAVPDGHRLLEILEGNPAQNFVFYY